MSQITFDDKSQLVEVIAWCRQEIIIWTNEDPDAAIKRH